MVSSSSLSIFETKASSSFFVYKNEKHIIERTIQYIKDRTECFDDYFPYRRKEKCNLFHVKNWINLFVIIQNKWVLNA